jgi:hypothetical protein
MRKRPEVEPNERRQSEKRRTQRERELVPQTRNPINLPVGQENVCDVPLPLNAESGYVTEKSQQ